MHVLGHVGALEADPLSGDFNLTVYRHRMSLSDHHSPSQSSTGRQSGQSRVGSDGQTCQFKPTP